MLRNLLALVVLVAALTACPENTPVGEGEGDPGEGEGEGEGGGQEEQGAFSREGLAAPPAKLVFCSRSRSAEPPETGG